MLITSLIVGMPVARPASASSSAPSQPMPWNEYGLLRGLKTPPRSMTAPAARTAFAVSMTWSRDSTAHGPPTTTNSPSPTVIAPTLMRLPAGCAVRAALGQCFAEAGISSGFQPLLLVRSMLIAGSASPRIPCCVALCVS
jgi:hypothetical protein